MYNLNNANWNELKTYIFKPIMKYEEINIGKYDFGHITRYSCLGSELQGYDVTCATCHHLTPFVYDTSYVVYYIPKKSNSKAYNGVEGEYFMVAYDEDNDNIITADFKFYIDRNATISSSALKTDINIIPWGEYTASIENNGQSIRIQKVKVGTKCTNGGNGRKNIGFDPQGQFLKAHGLNKARLASMVSNKKSTSVKNIFKSPKKYHKKRNIS